MRLCLMLIAGWLAAGAVVRADEQMVQNFDGHNSLTTSDFQVPDGWEIRWTSQQVLSIGVIRLDKTVVAGATGRNIGSLYVPQGGTYRIRVRGADPIPWDVKVYTLGPVTPEDAGAEITFYKPTPGPGYTPPRPVAVAVMTPPVVPVVAPVPPTELSAAQLRSIVTVKGDRAQGAGFFFKTGGGTVVVTTLDLLSNNPNLELDTATGARLTITQIQGATDRDVALIGVKDFGFPTLDPGDVSAVQPGDLLLTTSADGALHPAAPVVVSVGPQRIETGSLHAVPGAPLVLAKTGKVIGVAAAGSAAVPIENFNDQGFTEREAGRANALAPGVLRFDNVSGLETCLWDRLQNQTMFLDDFQRHTRELDSYLNGAHETGPRLWQGDEKIKSANSSFLLATPAGGDPAERNDALHALLFELGLVADTDMDQIALPGNFYSCEKKRAQDEMAYRRALKAQLEKFNDNLKHFNKIVLHNN